MRSETSFFVPVSRSQKLVAVIFADRRLDAREYARPLLLPATDMIEARVVPHGDQE